MKFTLPWLAEGNYIYLIGGKQKGIFAKHGIDIDISRGFGSLAAGQAITAEQFEFGTMITTPIILLVAKELPLVSLATMHYDSGMGVGMLGDSQITSPAMLVGKKIGDVPTSAEFPFLPAFAKKAGFSTDSVQFVNTDNKVLERIVAERQVDAITGIASFSLPIFISKNILVRWLLYSSAGLPSYGTGLTATQATLAKERGLCEAMTEAVCECLAYSLNEPEEATSLFLNAMPELALNPGAKTFLQIGAGVAHPGQHRRRLPAGRCPGYHPGRRTRGVPPHRAGVLAAYPDLSTDTKSRRSTAVYYLALDGSKFPSRFCGVPVVLPNCRFGGNRFRAVDRTALRLCQSLTASIWQTFMSVRLPYAIPPTVAGLKVGVTVAIIGVVIGEFVTAQEGLGYIIMFASSAAQTALVFAAIALLCGIGLMLYGAVALAEWLVRPWYGAPISLGGFE